MIISEYGYFFYPGRLEERVAEDAVRLAGPVQVPDRLVPLLPRHQAFPDRVLLDTLDHRGEGLPGEPFDKSWARGVDIDHPGRDLNRPKTGTGNERVQLPPDKCVTTDPALEIDKIPDRRVGLPALRVK